MFSQLSIRNHEWQILDGETHMQLFNHVLSKCFCCHRNIIEAEVHTAQPPARAQQRQGADPPQESAPATAP